MTSTQSKRKYNDKTYSRWFADIKKDDFEMLEEARGAMSRSQFLLMLYENYKNAEE